MPFCFLVSGDEMCPNLLSGFLRRFPTPELRRPKQAGQRLRRRYKRCPRAPAAVRPLLHLLLGVVARFRTPPCRSASSVLWHPSEESKSVRRRGRRIAQRKRRARRIAGSQSRGRRAAGKMARTRNAGSLRHVEGRRRSQQSVRNGGKGMVKVAAGMRGWMVMYP